jgi:hypothetical protein
MNRHSKLKPRVMERHNDGCGRLGADAGKTARDRTLIQVCRTIFDDGNKTHVYSILKYVGCQEEFLGFLGGQGFSKVRFLSGNDTNSGRPRCLPHFSYTCTAPNCILASDVKSVAKQPYSRLLKSPAALLGGLDSHIDLWLEYCEQWLGFSSELEVDGL